TAVIAQRLVRRVCPDCRQVYQPSDEELRELGVSRADLARFEGDGKVYRATGCQLCGRNGYRGRTGISEFLLIDDAVPQLILKNVDSNSIKKRAVEKGMSTLLRDGARKVALGETTIAEVVSITQEDI